MQSAKTEKNSTVKLIIFDSVVFGYLLTVFLVGLLDLDENYMLDLGRNASVFLGLMVLGGLLSGILNKFQIKTLGGMLFGASQKKIETQVVPWYKAFWGMQLIVFFITTCVVGIYQTDFSLYELFDESGFAGMVRLVNGIISPNFQVLPQAVMNVIETIFIAFMATVIAVPMAFVLSFLCAKNVMHHPTAFPFYVILRTILNVIRSVEALVWAIIFSVWVGIGPFAGMLALMLHSVASLAKQYSEIVECVDDGPIEGIMATGATPLQVIWFAVVPQIVLPYVSFTIYRWDINVRMATIIGLVGGGGIGTMLIKYQGQALWSEVGCIILVIAAVVWLMDTASAYIREAIK